jgi:hypothetical protein
VAEVSNLEAAERGPGLKATLISLLVIAATAVACTSEPDKPAAPPVASSSAAPQQVSRPICETALPAAWQQAIDDNRVDAGGSTTPLAVGRAGEIVAVRDNGHTRDVLLISADKSVKEVYPVPDPNRNNAGFAAVDDRWIVVGVVRSPRGANGVLPTLSRIDVIDRNGGPVRNVVQANDEDFQTGGPTIDSVALFDGKVYWITHEKYASSNGVTRSYDPNTGVIAEVSSGSMGTLRATAIGLTGIVDDPSNRPTWTHTEVIRPAQLPTPVADAVGTGPDRWSVTTDGTAYAWLTGVDHGATGVAWWSPQSGLVRIAGDIVKVKDWLPPVSVVGPYVVIGEGRNGSQASATVVDARSGAVTSVDPWVVDADGGTIGLSIQYGANGKSAPSYPVVLRVDQLPPLAC